MVFVAFIFVLVGWYSGLVLAPLDAQQGNVYRIIYVHVPVAACALAVSGIGLFISSLLCLFRNSNLANQRAWVEVGLLFTVLTLATGSIWGKPTWGDWWEWDARLTTTLLLAIMFCGYLLLFHALPKLQRQKICGIIGIIICIDIPIIYKSVSWWRTLHQPASLMETRGESMDPAMLNILLLNLIAMSLLCFMMWRQRRKTIKLNEELQECLL